MVEGAVLIGEEDDGVWGAEFEDGLAAGSAGLAGGMVEVGDGDGADAEVRAVESDGGGDGSLLGAGGEAVGGVFYVAAGDDGAVFEENSGAYAEVTIGGVGVLSGGGSFLLELLDQRGGEVGGWIRRHVCEANRCLDEWQGMGRAFSPRLDWFTWYLGRWPRLV